MIEIEDDYWISHITDNMYMGGCFKGKELPGYIDHVISLDDYHLYNIKDDVTYKVHPLIDIEEEPNREKILAIAVEAYWYVLKGPTLIHCFAGQNRSGLICATTLVLSGMKPQDAIDLLREKRFPEVLSNKSFEKFVLELDQ